MKFGKGLIKIVVAILVFLAAAVLVNRINDEKHYRKRVSFDINNVGAGSIMPIDERVTLGKSEAVTQSVTVEGKM